MVSPVPSAVGGPADWLGERSGDPGDHEEVLGGEPLCSVSSQRCGRVAPLPSSSPGPGPKVRGHLTTSYLFCLQVHPGSSDPPESLSDLWFQVLHCHGVSSQVPGNGGEGRSAL